MTSAHDHDEASQEDIDRVSEAMRATAPRSSEPDWSKLAADIGAAVDGEAKRQRRSRVLWIGGAVLAAAAVAALLVLPANRPSGQRAQIDDLRDARQALERHDGPSSDEARRAAIAAMAAELASDDAALDEDDVAVPDDLGGITVDEDLIDEAAAALDDDLGDEADAIDDRLLPDGAWIDELSDDELERAAAILDGEAG